MTQNTDPSQNNAADLPYDSLADRAGERGSDDRRGTVNPADSPAPSSPAPDEDALRSGEEKLDSVKPY
jgi:hypothetical protein